MSFIVEDGTGVTGATSYSSVQDAGRWHQARGQEDRWTELKEDGASEGALIDASRIMDRAYQYSAEIWSVTQGLALPRTTIYLPDGRTLDQTQQVSIAAEAAAMLALRLWEDQHAAEGGRYVTSESLPDVSWDYELLHGDYKDVDRIISQLVDSGTLGKRGIGQQKVVRWS